MTKKLIWTIVALLGFTRAATGWGISPGDVINDVWEGIEDVGEAAEDSYKHVKEELSHHIPREWKEFKKFLKDWWKDSDSTFQTSSDYFRKEVATYPADDGRALVDVLFDVRLTSIGFKIFGWDQPANAVITICQPSGTSIRYKSPYAYASSDVEFLVEGAWNAWTDPENLLADPESVKGVWTINIPGSYKMATIVLTGKKMGLNASAASSLRTGPRTNSVPVDIRCSFLVRETRLRRLTEPFCVPGADNPREVDFVGATGCVMVAIGVELNAMVWSPTQTMTVVLSPPGGGTVTVPLAGREVGRDPGPHKDTRPKTATKRQFVLWSIDSPDDRGALAPRDFKGTWRVQLTGGRYTTASIRMTFMSPKKGEDYYNGSLCVAMRRLSREQKTAAQIDAIRSFMKDAASILFSYQEEKWARKKLRDGAESDVDLLLRSATRPPSFKGHLTALTTKGESTGAITSGGEQQLRLHEVLFGRYPAMTQQYEREGNREVNPEITEQSAAPLPPARHSGPSDEAR